MVFSDVVAKTFSVQGAIDHNMMGKLIDYLQKYKRFYHDHEDLFLMMLTYDENPDDFSLERKVSAMLTRVVMSNFSYRKYLYKFTNKTNSTRKSHKEGYR
jgi:hypothetical protein